MTPKRKKRKEISAREREIIVKLWKKHKTYREIGKTVGRTHSSIKKVVQNFKLTKGFVSQPRSGRPWILTNRELQSVAFSTQKS